MTTFLICFLFLMCLEKGKIKYISVSASNSWGWGIKEKLFKADPMILGILEKFAPKFFCLKRCFHQSYIFPLSNKQIYCATSSATYTSTAAVLPLYYRCTPAATVLPLPFAFCLNANTTSATTVLPLPLASCPNSLFP